MPPVHPYTSSQHPTVGSVARDCSKVFRRFRRDIKDEREELADTITIGRVVVDVGRHALDYVRQHDWRGPIRQLAAIEETTARLERQLMQGAPAQAVATGRGPVFSVAARPTVDQRYEVEVRGGSVMDRRAALVFTQNGRERRGRVTELGGTQLRGDIPLRELDSPGPWAVVLEQGGRRDELTTVEVG